MVKASGLEKSVISPVQETLQPHDAHGHSRVSIVMSPGWSGIEEMPFLSACLLERATQVVLIKKAKQEAKQTPQR